MTDKPVLIETPWPEVYSNYVEIVYDGFALVLDFRRLRPDPADPSTNSSQVSVARVAMAPIVAKGLVDQLTDLLTRIAAQGLKVQPPSPSKN